MTSGPLDSAIDAHVHVWDLSGDGYEWLTPELAPINRSYVVEEITSQMATCDVVGGVLVQADDSLADTESMLAAANVSSHILGVVGWVPLTDVAAATEALDRFQADPLFCGVRHLIHDEPDPRWLLRDDVLEGLALLAERRVPFDVVAVLPVHLEVACEVADRVPELRMVIDHLGKPPIAARGWEPWAGLLGEAASRRNVYAKVSGLNTAAEADWSADSLAPYVSHACELFGPERLMFGGDWPVCELAGDYAQVVRETRALLEGLGADASEAILRRTAVEFYGLEGAEAQ